MTDAYNAGGAFQRRNPMFAARRHLVFLLAALAVLAGPAVARAGGGSYVFSGGSDAARQQVVAALEASSFDWDLVPVTITVQISNCGCTGARPGVIVLDESLLADVPYGRAYTWGLVQHEYAHQVWYYAMEDYDRVALHERLGGEDLCYETPGLAHDEHACERFADTLAWAYWPNPGNPSRSERVIPRRPFRSLMVQLLGDQAWFALARHKWPQHRSSHAAATR